MKIIPTWIVLLLFAGSAQAECTDEVRKPQKPRDVARLKWTAAGRTWQVVLSWKTKSVSDNGEEEASVGLFVRDNINHPTIGDERLYRLSPNRCDKPIDPSLSTVKLMGRDFLLVTLPDSHGQTGGSGDVFAWMYSIDEKGHLTLVFHSAYVGHFMRTPECRSLLKSYIRPENPDGSRFAWVYEWPDVEWVRNKKECAKAELDRLAFTYEWKNGCFPFMEQPDPSEDRLLTHWDENECAKGVGRVVKAASPDGGAPPSPAAPSGGSGGRAKKSDDKGSR